MIGKKGEGGIPVNEESACNGCCNKLFYAEVSRIQKEVLLLQCCFCGRLWYRQPDGNLIPSLEDEPPRVER